MAAPINSAARSATAMTGHWVLQVGMTGKTDASATHSPSGSLKAVGMESKLATLYGANIAVLARATDWPRSKTSGARSVPLSWVAALISSWLLASGWAEFTSIPYLVPNALMISP